MLADVILDQVEAFDAQFPRDEISSTVESRITVALERWFGEGRRQIGEVVMEGGPGSFVLHHVDDKESDQLLTFEGYSKARQIARVDDEGNYRSSAISSRFAQGVEAYCSYGWGELREILGRLLPFCPREPIGC